MRWMGFLHHAIPPWCSASSKDQKQWGQMTTDWHLQNHKPFLFLSWLYQVFCNSNEKLTNTFQLNISSDRGAGIYEVLCCVRMSRGFRNVSSLKKLCEKYSINWVCAFFWGGSGAHKRLQSSLSTIYLLFPKNLCSSGSPKWPQTKPAPDAGFTVYKQK